MNRKNLSKKSIINCVLSYLKFPVALAKLAKSNPKIIPSSPTQITNKRKREPHDKVANQHTKRIKSHITPSKTKKEKIRKTKNDSTKIIDILKIAPYKKLEGYKIGQKVKIYNINNTNNYVEISWPIDSTIKNIVSLTRKQILDKKIKTNKGNEFT